MGDFDLRKWAGDMSGAIEAQQAALGAKVEEGRVQEIVDANLEPIRAEMEALGKQRMARQVDGRNRNQRDMALVGTRYEHLRDPFTGRAWTADDVEFLHDMLGAFGIKPSERLRNLYTEINTRAMDTAESGYGAELVGVQYVSDLWSGAREMSVLFSQLPTFEMTAPSAQLPVAAAPPEMLLFAESTASNSSNYPTSKTGSNRVTVTAKKLGIHQMWSGEMEEDSIIPFVPFLRDQATWSVSHYSDSMILNGDTTNAATGNINLDDADPDDNKHYLAFDGIRKVGLVDNTNNEDNIAAAIDYPDLIRAPKMLLDRAYLMDWGTPVNPADLIFATSPEVAREVALLDEVTTIDKYGAAATVINGEVTKVGRHPMVGTVVMPLTEADGKVSTTAGNNTLGQIALFNRRGFIVGWRRRARMETERLPATDQTRIVWTLRMGMGRFSPTGAASGIEAAAVLRNITLP